MRMIKTQDGIELYVKQWGSGRPVILIHGWPLSADSWDDQALALAEKGFKVIAYDRRGFGRSEQPWDGYQYDALADDLAAVIEHTGATNATLVGFSMGGGEVARYISRYQGKHVAQAVFIASIIPYLMKTPEHHEGVEPTVFEKMIEEILHDRPHFFGNFFKDFFGVGLLTSPVSEEVLRWSQQLAMQASLKATLDCVKAFSATDFRHDLSALASIPTLIIHGTADKTVPIDASSRVAAREISHAKYLEYDGAPHGLLVTHKEQLILDLLHFLSMVV